MPVYEYECMSCSTRFEVKRGFGEESEVRCPRCRVRARRLFSPVAIIYKGGGFYTTDSRKNGSRPKEGAGVSSAESSTEHSA